MTRNKIISSLVIIGVLAASVSSAALADDHRNHDRGNGAAIVAGVLGAVVIGSLIANSQPAYAAPQPYYQPQPYYEVPAQTYYPPPSVQQVYYKPPQQYYVPQPVTVIDGRYRDRHEYRAYRHHDRDGYDGYYSR
ncbi:hypothetical protein [Herminiimonas sp. CN]|uniref:hypothetical protein n=1 Tax=Herminiimonas sp. CN TaxID=1349818 RepID=UPI0009DF2C06|nr:hypothetical protein [Herminiimonas sp. CN]